jgi:fibronectin-binding autotransporter adhesin
MDGSEQVNINSNLAVRAGPHLFDGTGDGDLVIGGVLSGAGEISIEQAGTGAFVFANSANTFSGGITVNSGTLRMQAAANATLVIPSQTATSSFFGNVSSGAITINGGELALNTSGTGQITPGTTAEVLNFGVDGGLLALNGSLNTTNGFRLQTSADAATPAIVSHGVTNAWARTSGVSVASLAGSGEIRFEVSNGALANFFGTGAIGAAVTIAGEDGGTSSTVGDSATTVGKFLVEPSVTGGTLAFSTPLTLEHAVQVSSGSANQTLDADLLLVSDADVAIQGRGAVSGGTAADAQLTLGSAVGGRTITLETGAEFSIDSGFRSQARNGLVRLNANTVLAGGSTLAFRRTGAAAASVAPHVWAGNLIVNAPSGQALLDLQLDVASTGGSAVDVQASHQIVIDASGLGGLRVAASGSVASQTSGQRLQNYLSPARTAAISGTGGYLQIASGADAAFNFTQAHQWADADIGLRIENTRVGADLSFDTTAFVSFLRNLHLGDLAEVDVRGDSLGGQVTGTGTLSGDSTVLAGGRLSPGNTAGVAGSLSFADNLSLNDGALFTFDLALPSTSDLLAITGSLNLNDQEFSDFTFNPLPGFAGGTYPLMSAAAITGSLGPLVSGNVGGFPSTLNVSGGTLFLTVIPEPGSVVVLPASVALIALRRRRGRRD